MIFLAFLCLGIATNSSPVVAGTDILLFIFHVTALSVSPLAPHRHKSHHPCSMSEKGKTRDWTREWESQEKWPANSCYYNKQSPYVTVSYGTVTLYSAAAFGGQSQSFTLSREETSIPIYYDYCSLGDRSTTPVTFVPMSVKLDLLANTYHAKVTLMGYAGMPNDNGCSKLFTFSFSGFAILQLNCFFIAITRGLFTPH